MMNTLFAFAAAVRTRIVRLAEGLANRVAAFMASLDRRGLPAVPPVAGVGTGAAVVLGALVVAAGCPPLAPFALLGVKHLAAAWVLDLVLRRVPWRRLAPAGRGLRAMAAVGLLWVAAASFDAGRTIAPRPVAVAAVPGATVAGGRPAFATDVAPGVDAPPAPSGAHIGWRGGRTSRLKPAPDIRA